MHVDTPKPDSLRIDRLGLDEGPRLRLIRLRALAEAPDAFGSTLAETAARPDSSWAQQVRDLPTFVAVSAGQDVGMVRGAADPDGPGSAWLLSLWVDPAARGRGVGDALVDAVVAWARASAFTELLLDVADANPHAVALYARKGFQPTGESGSLPAPREHIREHRRRLSLSAPGGR